MAGTQEALIGARIVKFESGMIYLESVGGEQFRLSYYAHDVPATFGEVTLQVKARVLVQFLNGHGD